MRRCFLPTGGFLVLTLLLSNAPAPADEGGWINLFPGKDLSAWRDPAKDWIYAGGAHLDPKNPRQLEAEPGEGVWVNGPKGRIKDLLTKEKYGDLEAHVEFLIGKGSNSGVKFGAVYEVQILDSYGKKELSGDSCGGIYPRAELKPKYHHIDQGIPPKTNAAKPAGEWQTLDMIFLAPRFDADGKKTANARLVRVLLNGITVHEHQELQTPTGNNWNMKEVPTGPFMLQADHGPVAFRNVRIRPYKQD